jgi:hypothetical protein
MNIKPVALKRGLLFFWAAWLSFVCLTNVLDGLQRLDILPAAWTYASGNVGLVLAVVQARGTPSWVAAILFAGVTSWEGLCAGLFWKAALRFRGDGPSRALAITAFAFSIALWAALCVAIEAFIAFDKISEGVFQTLLGVNLLSLLAICLLPDA